MGPDAGKVLLGNGSDEQASTLGYYQQLGKMFLGEFRYSSELYDPATNTLARQSTRTLRDVAQTATVLTSGPRSGWILLAAPDTTDLYDSFTHTVVAGPHSPHVFNYSTATMIPSGPNSGKILFAGGAHDPPNSTDLYDPVTNTFTPGPAMNIGRYGHIAGLIATGPNAGKILLVGGWSPGDSEHSVALASTELYDSETNSFAPPGDTASMKTARAFHTATTIPTGPNAGKILIAGGETNDFHKLSSTELYDPTSNSFSPGPQMKAQRAQHAAITIASGAHAGKILIAGGAACHFKTEIACGKVEASTEFYDPATNTFAPGPLMYGAPGDVVAVQLPSSPPPRSGTGVKSHVPTRHQ
ncbi:MAG: Kelch repeat-containing protein [Candidatus Binataceae bacterium]